MAPANSSSGLLLVCEVRLYREGLRDGLAQRCAVPVVAMASNVTEALAQVRACNPAIVLLDMGLPDAPLFVQDMIAEGATTSVIALGIQEDSPAVLNCVELGAAAYVTKEATMEELALTIEAAARGEAICSPRVAASLFRRLAVLARQRSMDSEVNGLTQREQEILGLIDQGLSNKEIARRLRLQLATVKNHVHHILEKLGVTRRSAAAALARRPSRKDPNAEWIV